MKHEAIITIRGIDWVNMDAYHPDDTKVAYMAKFGEHRAIVESCGRWEVRGLRTSWSSIERSRTLKGALEVATNALLDSLIHA